MIDLKRFYITTAIDYVNAPPHIGHLFEKVGADIIARFHRLLGEDVFFLTGTDENASKNERAAKEAGVPVKKFVEKNSERFINLCKIFNISNDDFIRTTQERHVEVAQLLFKKLYKIGDVYKGFYEGYYCPLCEEFKSEKELIHGKCPEHETKPEHLKEENYFFRCSRHERNILKILKEDFVLPAKRRKEITERIERNGLKDVSVSRPNLTWGIDTPIDPKHKIYVWFDALVNYVSALDYPHSEKYKRFWPADVHVVGKGINWFHSVMWPAILLSAGIPLPKHILIHGYLTVDGKKISKSSNHTIDPIDLAQKYPVDAIRYYLIRQIPFEEDGDFREENLIEKNNNELVANIGNFIHRVLSFIWNYFDGEVPTPRELDESDSELENRIRQIAREIGDQLKNFRLDKALAKINEFSIFCNRYFQKKEPWRTKDANCLYLGINAVRSLAILLAPFVPSSARKLWSSLGLAGRIHNKDWYSASELTIKAGHKTKRPETIFKKI